MNWNDYLKKYTADLGRVCDTDLNVSNHHGYTFNFFKNLKIDAPNKTFLDIGCGTGNTRAEIKAEWHGIDLIKTNTPNTIIGDAHDLPYNDNTFDIIFCSHTLEHTLSPLICLLEMKRVLKLNGDIVIGVPVYPGFVGSDHNWVMIDFSWRHLFEQCRLHLMSSEEQSHCAVYHLKDIEKVFK